MAINPITTVRKIVSMPHELATAVERFRFDEHIKTEAEAYRRLIERGLALHSSSQIDVHVTADGREGVLTGLGEFGSYVLSRQALNQLHGFLTRELEKYPEPLPRPRDVER